MHRQVCPRVIDMVILNQCFDIKLSCLSLYLSMSRYLLQVLRRNVHIKITEIPGLKPWHILRVGYKGPKACQ